MHENVLLLFHCKESCVFFILQILKVQIINGALAPLHAPLNVVVLTKCDEDDNAIQVSG